MKSAHGAVRYRQEEGAATFRVEGRGTMPLGLPLRRCVERLMTDGVSQVRIDLRDCSHLDSTFLGTLLTLKKQFEHHNGRLTLIAPSPACAKILGQMGLDGTLPVEDAEVPADGWVDLVLDTVDPDSFRRNVTQAHEELARLPGPAGEQFKSVIRCLEQSRDSNPTDP